MWHNAKDVIRTHCKFGSQQAWAIVKDVSPGWLRIKTGAVDGVMNIYMILSMALANGRKVDVYVENNQITQATLR
jgi:hypothetical protein